MKNLSFLRSSPYAKTIHKHCLVFLAVDLVLVCLVVYGWYTICNYNFCTTLSRKQSTTRILAFGDSMTRGLVNRKRYYPYSKSLEKTLNRVHSRDTVFVVDNGGLNGDRAIGRSKARLRIALRRKKYDWVILLFGTNDLSQFVYNNTNGKGFNVRPSYTVGEVFKSLTELCKIALEGHQMLILGTITARQCEENAFYEPSCDNFRKKRELLNEKIRSYVATSTDMILLVDFDRHLNYKNLNEVKRTEYWQDNVHLTETGYEFMAKLVYKKMQPYLPEPMRQPYVASNARNGQRYTTSSSVLDI